MKKEFEVSEDCGLCSFLFWIYLVIAACCGVILRFDPKAPFLIPALAFIFFSIVAWALKVFLMGRELKAWELKQEELAALEEERLEQEHKPAAKTPGLARRFSKRRVS